MERRDGLSLARGHVRLEPFALAHEPPLVTAIDEDPSSFGFSTVPDNESAMVAWVQDALAGRDAGRELPFATYSLAHARIVGSTRFYELEYWRSPAEHPQHDQRPDACLIGYHWLGGAGEGTG